MRIINLFTPILFAVIALCYFFTASSYATGFIEGPDPVPYIIECPEGAAGLPGLPCPEPLPLPEREAPWAGRNVPKGEFKQQKLNAAGVLVPMEEDEVTCDVNFMNQIYGRAFLEAEREVVVANTIMKKPDSVLEYTCFDQHVADSANYIGPIFTESTAYENVEVDVLYDEIATINSVLDPEYLDRSLEKLVLKSLKGYVGGHFWHDFLGGALIGENNTISETVAGVDGVCDFMFNIHHVAKCDDFALDAPFMYFNGDFGRVAMTTTDPRTLPVECPEPHRITQNIIDLANNKDRAYALFEPIDANLPFIHSVSEGICENPVPIPTGVTVKRSRFGTDISGKPIVIAVGSYPDAVCSNPGCFYNSVLVAGTTDTYVRECIP